MFFEKFSPRDELESSGHSWVDLCGGSCGFSVCLPVGSPGVPVVTVVPVSPLSTGVLGEGFFSGSDCELVESQPSSLSSKRQAFLTEVKKTCVWRIRRQNCRQSLEGRFRRWIEESTTGGPPSTMRSQGGCELLGQK